MVDITLDKNGDIAVSENGDISLTESICQAVQIRLKSVEDRSTECRKYYSGCKQTAVRIFPGNSGTAAVA